MRVTPKGRPGGGETALAVRRGGARVVQAQPDAAEPLAGGEGGKRVAEFVGHGGEQAKVTPGKAGQGHGHCQQDHRNELGTAHVRAGGMGESGNDPLPPCQGEVRFPQQAGRSHALPEACAMQYAVQGLASSRSSGTGVAQTAQIP